jgi:hypothetical protein
VRKKVFLLVLINALGIISVFAQDRTSAFEDFWVCPVFESGLYGVSNIGIGGGAALGYGDRVAFGLKVLYWNDLETLRALELNFLMRFYFFHMSRATALGHSGLFIQFNGGPVLFARDETHIAVPTDMTLISAGISLGWRFLLGRYFFIEPAVRAGYPYLAGVGLAAGVCF